MSTFISNILDKLSEKFWVIVAISMGCFITPIGFGVASLLVRSSSLSYESGDTKINVGQVKKISNNTEYANKVLKDKISRLEQEINSLKQLDDNPQIEKVNRAFSELKPTANQAIESSEELTELIEQNIE